MINVKDLVWNREPLDYKIEEDKIEIWQGTGFVFRCITI